MNPLSISYTKHGKAYIGMFSRSTDAADGDLEMKDRDNVDRCGRPVDISRRFGVVPTRD